MYPRAFPDRMMDGRKLKADSCGRRDDSLGLHSLAFFHLNVQTSSTARLIEGYERFIQPLLAANAAA